MGLRSFLIKDVGEPRPKGRSTSKAEALIAVMSTAELRDWIDKYLYIIGRSLSEYSRNPTERGFLYEAVEAGQLLNLCLKRLEGQI